MTTRQKSWLFCLAATLIPILSCNEITGPEAVTGLQPSAAVASNATSAVPQISAGYHHTCGLKSDGTVVCWGNNAYGQATVPAGLASVSKISAGWHHTCALRSDATVLCWGDNSYNQSTVPTGLTAVTEIAAGYYYSCAVRSDATVACWGGGAGLSGPPSGLTGVGTLSLGPNHGCAVKTNRTVVCWGSNNYGQSAVPAKLNGVARVSAGYGHTCALKTAGTVVCWGDNTYGQTLVPANLTGVTDLSAGSFHTCAFTSTGVVRCWGSNAYGQLDNPGPFSSLTGISSGEFYSCVLKADGTVICWGYLDASVPDGLNLRYRTQTITFTYVPPSPAVVGTKDTVSATGGGSGKKVTFSSLSSTVCTVTVNVVKFNANGSCVIAADQAASGDYLAAPRVQTIISVGQTAQAISFTSTPPNPALVGGFYKVVATGGGSGNPVTFSSPSTSVCTVSNDTVSLNAVGSCTVAADQAAGGGYTAAPQVTQEFTVASSSQTITFTSTAPSGSLIGDTYEVSATGGASGNPVTFSSLSTSVCTVSGSTVTLSATGQCTVAADQAAGGGYDSAQQETQSFAVSYGGAWTTRASMPTPRIGAGVATINGIVYVVGGYNNNNGQTYATLEAYDPSTDSWSTKAPMPTKRGFLGVAVADGILYAVGGFNENPGGSVATVESYDPVTNAWTARAPMTTPRNYLGVTALNGILYAAGGYNNGYLASIEAYDPATNTWSARASLPTARMQLALASANGQLYAVGGYNGSGYSARVDAYDPGPNSWSTKAAMPTARGALSTAELAGVLYAVGGTTNSGIVATVEAYDPVSNTWTRKAGMPTARDFLGVAATGTRLFAIGGKQAPFNEGGNLATVEEFQP